MTKTEPEKPEAPPEPERPMPTNVIAAIARVTEEMGGIRKMTAAERQQRGMGGGDTGISYAYRGIDQIAQAAQPLFGRYGVVIVPNVLSTEVFPITVNGKPWTDMTMEIEWTIYGPGGIDDCIKAVTTGQGRDGADKGANKSNTGAFKNLLLRILCIGDPADDTDGHTHEGDEDQTRTQPQGNGKRETTERDPAVDPVMDTFKRVSALKGTPLGETVKEYAAQAKKPLTMQAFNAAREWLAEINLFIDSREKTQAAVDAGTDNDMDSGNGAKYGDEDQVAAALAADLGATDVIPPDEPGSPPEDVKPKRQRTAREMAAEKEGT